MLSTACAAPLPPATLLTRSYFVLKDLYPLKRFKSPQIKITLEEISWVIKVTLMAKKDLNLGKYENFDALVGENAC